jgi:hypothetical protein
VERMGYRCSNRNPQQDRNVESYKTSDNYNLIIIIWFHLFEGWL